MGMKGDLESRLIRAPKNHIVRQILRTPFGRVLWSRDRGEALAFGNQIFATNLTADLFNKSGRHLERRDLGSGLVTNVGVLSMCNDFGWSAQLNLSTLGLANWVATGTGATAAAATDFKMQTLAAPTTTTAVSGTQTLVPPTTFVGPTSPIFKQVTTVNYGSSLAITEWGLHSSTTLSSSTGTPFTAATTSTWTDTGSAQTASSATVRGLQGTLVIPGTTAVLGLNVSNTTHIQFSYSLSINSGG